MKQLSQKRADQKLAKELRKERKRVNLKQEKAALQEPEVAHDDTKTLADAFEESCPKITQAEHSTNTSKVELNFRDSNRNAAKAFQQFCGAIKASHTDVWIDIEAQIRFVV